LIFNSFEVLLPYDFGKNVFFLVGDYLLLLVSPSVLFGIRKKSEA
jgi:hypothetical protein